jgi:hypothetical protein
MAFLLICLALTAAVEIVLLVPLFMIGSGKKFIGVIINIVGCTAIPAETFIWTMHELHKYGWGLGNGDLLVGWIISLPVQIIGSIAVLVAVKKIFRRPIRFNSL